MPHATTMQTRWMVCCIGTATSTSWTIPTRSSLRPQAGAYTWSTSIWTVSRAVSWRRTCSLTSCQTAKPCALDPVTRYSIVRCRRLRQPSSCSILFLTTSTMARSRLSTARRLLIATKCCETTRPKSTQPPTVTATSNGTLSARPTVKCSRSSPTRPYARLTMTMSTARRNTAALMSARRVWSPSASATIISVPSPEMPPGACASSFFLASSKTHSKTLCTASWSCAAASHMSGSTILSGRPAPINHGYTIS